MRLRQRLKTESRSAGGSVNDYDDPPFEGGSQPIREHPPEVASRGRLVFGAIVAVISIAVLVAGILWLVFYLLN